MSRVQIVRRAFKEWHDKVEALPSDEKPVAYMIALAATVVILVAVIGVIALALNVLASYGWVLIAIAVLWYFWPRISDLIKKRG